MKTAMVLLLGLAGMTMDGAYGQAPIPDNDSFFMRIPLYGTNVTTTGRNTGATREIGEPDPSFLSEGSVWWTWTAPLDGSLTLSTAGSSYDTILTVFTGNAVTNLTLVAFNDTPDSTSTVTFNVVAGTTYQIAVDGSGGVAGNISLQLSFGPTQPPPPNDDFADAITLIGTHLSNVPGSNVGATVEPGEPFHVDTLGLKSVWWKWTAPSSGGVTLTTQGSSIDTVLAVYTGNSVTDLFIVAGNDEDPFAELQSRVTFNAVSNVTYRIAVDGFDGEAGDIRLRLDLDAPFPVPANDNFANAKVLSGSNVSTNGSNVGATYEADEPLHLVTFGGKSVWYTWTAPASGGVTLTASNSSLDTLVCVYRGNSLANLTFVAGNDEDFLTTVEGDSTAYFNVTGGTTYRIVVDGVDGMTGTFNLRLVLGDPDPVPANDNFANAIVLTGTNITTTGFNYGATLEAGEPLHRGYYGGKSVWWRWTAPEAGYVTINTIDSNTDTILAVYKGAQLSTLKEIASDDESGGNYTSWLRFPTKAGVTYQIAVDGYDGDGYDLTLHIRLITASYTLTVDTDPPGAGTVDIDPLPDQDGGTYAPGSIVTLTATPGSNATFIGWSGHLDSTNNPVSLVVSSNKTIVADFFVPPTTKIWTGGNAQIGNWGNSQNWDSGSPNPGDDLIFPAGADRLTSNTNNFATNTVFRSITFGGDGYILKGRPVILTAGIVSTNAGGTNTFNLNVQLNSNQTFACRSPAAALVIGGNVNLGNRTLTAETMGDIRLSGVVSGTGGIVKTNSGTLGLVGNNTNTYTGATIVSEGTLELGKTGVAVAGLLTIGDGLGGVNADVVRFSGNSQLANSSAVFINSSGRLDLNGFGGSVGSLTMTGGSVDTGTGSLGLNGNITANAASAQASITGNLSLQGATRTFNVANGPGANDLLVSAVIGNGSGSAGIAKTGAGTLQLTAANTYSGTTTINEGALAIFNPAALGATNQGTVVTGASLLSVNDVTVSDETLALEDGMLEFNGGTNSWTGRIQLTNTCVITVATNAQWNLTGFISGPGGLTKTGTGALVFSGPSNNTYAGLTRVNQGTLLLSKTTSNAVPGALIVGDGTGGADADVVRLDSSQQISINSAVTINGSGLLDLKTFGNAIASLTGNGHVELGSATLSVGYDNSSTSFNGIISGAGGLTKAGSGTLFLAGDNTYTGLTRINDGSLIVNGSQPNSPVEVNAPGVLGGTGRVGNISGSGTISPGVSPGILSSGSITFTSNTTFLVELNGPNPGLGYDQLKIGGDAHLAGALQVTSAFASAINDTFTIVDNNANDSIVGTFNNLPEGGFVIAGGATFQISYAAGSRSNDVVLTHVQRPEVTCPLTIMTNTAPGFCSQTVAFGASVNTNPSSPTVTYKLNGLPISSPHVFPAGTNTVVVTATNGVPPDAMCVFTVIVADRQPPAITCPTNITVTAAGACPITVDFNPSASDNCLLASLVANPPSGTAFSIGSNPVNVTALDASGNSNTCSFTVTVLPGPAPELTILSGSGNSVVVCWPASNGCYQLQYVPGFSEAAESNAWTMYSGSLTTNGGFICVTNGAASSNRFYRLFY